MREDEPGRRESLGARLHAAELPEQGGRLVLPAAAAKHARALHVRAGDRITLFDGRGRYARGEVRGLDGASVECSMRAPVLVESPAASMVLVQAMPKGQKLELIVRMATELGVGAIQLAVSERTVARPRDARVGARLQRLERIALEACAQAAQPYAPRLLPPQPLLEAAGAAPADTTRLVCWEQARATLGQALARADLSARPPWAVVGPEGGLSAGEIEALRELGYQPVSLGASILRVETAAVAMVTLARFLGGQ